MKAFDKIVETMRKIKECLPDFSECARLFDHDSGVLEVLSLFYREILEFYGILLRFLRIKGIFFTVGIRISLSPCRLQVFL